MATTMTPAGGRQRKTLAHQLDRLDAVLDGLSDGLNEAITDAVRAAVGPAVRAAVAAALKDQPAAAPAAPAGRPSPAAAAPTGRRPLSMVWRALAWVWARLTAAAVAVTATVQTLLRRGSCQLARGRVWCRQTIASTVANAVSALAGKWRQAARAVRQAVTVGVLAAALVRRRRGTVLAGLVCGAAATAACWLAGPLPSAAACGAATAGLALAAGLRWPFGGW